MDRIYLKLEEVLLIHYTAIEVRGGMHGLRDPGTLQSAVARPQTGYYNDIVEEAAALLESLIGNHPFFDANKRTGFVAASSFLRANGYHIAVGPDDAERFLLDTLKSGTFKFPVIVEWLRKVVKPLR